MQNCYHFRVLNIEKKIKKDCNIIICVDTYIYVYQILYKVQNGKAFELVTNILILNF